MNYSAWTYGAAQLALLRSVWRYADRVWRVRERFQTCFAEPWRREWGLAE